MTKQWQDSINKNNLIVDEDEIASVVSTWTKIPVQRIAQAESERLMKLRRNFTQQGYRTGRGCCSCC